MYLNLTDDKGLKGEWELLMSSDTIDVSVNAKWIDSICIPAKDGDVKITATFRTMTCEEYWEIERECTTIRQTEHEEIKDVGYQEMRKLCLQRMLVNWSLDTPLEFNDKTGWLTNECFSKVLKMPAPLISILLSRYEDSFTIYDEEAEKIEKQGMALFRPTSKGVENACRAITLFCALSNFWEKFGLNRNDMKNLSYREYVMLRLVVAKETEALAAVHGREKGHQRAGKYTKVVGPGGKIRESRGTVIPL